MLSEPILVVARLVQAFDTLGVAYVVGGSLASSVYGVPRATQDVDLVADLKVLYPALLHKSALLLVPKRSCKGAVRQPTPAAGPASLTSHA